MVEHQSDELEVAAPTSGETRKGSIPAARSRKPFAWGVRWGERLGRPECPYIRRWSFGFGLFTIRVHHWYSSDDDRAPHDHPWWFLTLILRGYYHDVHYTIEEGRNWKTTYEPMRSGTFHFRRAKHIHWVKVPPEGCWTILLTGRPLNEWGFWVPRKLDHVYRHVKSKRYFFTHKHHPCE